jgi:hypothetical protein
MGFVKIKKKDIKLKTKALYIVVYRRIKVGLKTAHCKRKDQCDTCK